MKRVKWVAMPAMLACLVAALVGCGGQNADYGQLGLVSISGTVTLDGEPVAGAAVYFYEPDESYCFGVTDAMGEYTMMLNSEKSGVTPGKKTVKISTASNPLGDAAESPEGEMAEEEDPDAKAGGASEQIPACYNKDSKLEIDVSASDSSLDFELKSDCSTVSPS